MSSSFRSNGPLAEIALPTEWRAALPWLLVAGFAQATLVHVVAFRGAVPSLILLVVAIFAVRAGATGAVLFGALAGVLEDALGGNTGAAWTIATSLTALGLSLSSRVLFTDSVSIFTVILVGASLAREAMYWAVISLEGYPVGLGSHYVKLAVASALYTALVALVAAWAHWRFAAK